MIEYSVPAEEKQEEIPPRPTPLDAQLSNIPAELQQVNWWLLWRYEWRDGKWTKTPYNAKVFTDWRLPAKEKRARVNDPDTWSDFATVAALYEQHRDVVDGIGLVVVPPLVGADIDHCYNGTGLSSYAQHVLAKIDSYTEFSPRVWACESSPWANSPTPYASGTTGSKYTAGTIT
jgi:primase-polymerase (primpol)-like protein